MPRNGRAGIAVDTRVTDSGETSSRDRGSSDVLAVVLLVAMVIAGAVLVAASGGRIVEGTHDRLDREAALSSFHEMDSRLATISHEGTTDRTDIAFGTDDPDTLGIDRNGSITIAINNGTCSATVPLTSISYETRDGGTLIYEAGGIWERDANGTHLVSPPDLDYRDRTIALSILNLSGRVSGSELEARQLPSSIPDTRAINHRLFDDRACLRPDSVTVAVTSEQYRAWGRYLVDEFGLDVDRESVIDGENRTARVTVRERGLPRAADDDRNQVVDFDGGYGQHANGTISVNKGEPSLTYPVSITLLSDETQGGRPTVAVHRNRRALDVVFTIDESGSMGNDGKLLDTQTAATGFLDRLNETAGDRIGVVGYSDTGPCHFLFNPCPPNYPNDARVHAGLDGDFDAAEESIEDDLRAEGDTPIAAGVNRTVDHVLARGDGSHERIVVLLSDGKHNGDGNVTAAAERAADHDIAIYTVGFGDDVGEHHLRTLANRTGGKYYHASNGSELREQFESIALEIEKTRTIRLTPVTIRAGAATLLPNGSINATPPNGTAHDLKDPSLSFPLVYSSTLPDGETAPITLARWNCEEWSLTNQTVTGPDGYSFEKAACSVASAPAYSINGSSHPGRIRTFTAGDTTADLPDSPGSWVESNVTAMLKSHGFVNGSGGLSLESNEVILAYDLPEGDEYNGDFNDLVLVVTVGYSTEEVRVTYAVQVTVSNVRIDTDP